MDSTGKLDASIRVWDAPVRIIHWALVLAVFGAWITRELEGDWFAWHTRFGYTVLVLVLTRVIWGFVGSRYARFAEFVRGPRAIGAYLRGLRRGAEQDSASAPVGHNPLGALMILALLAMLAAQAITGLFANDQIFQTGPLFGYVSVALSDQLTTWHKRLFDVLWVAILLHVVAALFYAWVLKQNLILPMFTGRKRGAYPPDADMGRSRPLLAWVIAALLALFLAWLVSTAPEAFLFDF